jgi:hypothetical protein
MRAHAQRSLLRTYSEDKKKLKEIPIRKENVNESTILKESTGEIVNERRAPMSKGYMVRRR